MSWFVRFITSSLGKKLVMSLTGLFLILFLVVHLVGNLQLLMDDGGASFNKYAYFMTHFLPVTIVSYGLYLSILLHAVQGVLIWQQNRVARGNNNYAVKVTRTIKTSSFASKNMAWLGIIIFVFIVIHMYQFWAKMHWGPIEKVVYDGKEVNDLYTIVSIVYTQVGFVIFYVVAMVVVAIHLWHGFQSAFQTLGLNHKKYTPIIRFLGKAYSILIPLAFAIIPILMMLNIAF